MMMIISINISSCIGKRRVKKEIPGMDIYESSQKIPAVSNQ
jgi:hypothetical protein